MGAFLGKNLAHKMVAFLSKKLMLKIGGAF